MLTRFYLNVLTPKRLVSRDEKRKVLDLICNVYPDIAPERYGYYEPLRAVFDASHPEKALEIWTWGFFWKRTRTGTEGAAFASTYSHEKQSWVSISMKASKADPSQLAHLLQTASSELCADHAFVHLLVEQDLPIGYATKTTFCLDPKRGGYSLGITGHELARCLPDLYWATILGPPYVEYFGRELILSAPCPIIRELGGGGIYLQLSDDPFDLQTDFAGVDAVRRAVKRHLNHNAFFDPDVPADHVYSVPEFRMDPLPGETG